MITYIGSHFNTWVTKSFTLFHPSVVIETQSITNFWMITYELFLTSSFRKLT